MGYWNATMQERVQRSIDTNNTTLLLLTLEPVFTYALRLAGGIQRYVAVDDLRQHVHIAFIKCLPRYESAPHKGNLFLRAAKWALLGQWQSKANGGKWLKNDIGIEPDCYMSESAFNDTFEESIEAKATLSSLAQFTTNQYIQQWLMNNPDAIDFNNWIEMQELTELQIIRAKEAHRRFRVKMRTLKENGQLNAYL